MKTRKEKLQFLTDLASGKRDVKELFNQHQFFTQIEPGMDRYEASPVYNGQKEVAAAQIEEYSREFPHSMIVTFHCA